MSIESAEYAILVEARKELATNGIARHAIQDDQHRYCSIGAIMAVSATDLDGRIVIGTPCGHVYLALSDAAHALRDLHVIELNNTCSDETVLEMFDYAIKLVAAS